MTKSILLTGAIEVKAISEKMMFAKNVRLIWLLVWEATIKRTPLLGF